MMIGSSVQHPIASKILLQTNQNENTLQARDFLDSDALEIDEPLSECGSSVGSLTLTMTHPTELLGQTESSQDDFNTDLCLAEESDLHVGVGGELDLISSQRSQLHSMSTERLGHTSWTYYEEEYSQLRKAFHTLQTGFLEFLVLVSKGGDRKHVELLNVDKLLPKNCLSSFHKCLSPTESTASSGAGCGRRRFDLLEFKLWKKHYCAMLDAFDLVYKDCQLLGKLRGNRTEYELTTVHSGRALQSEFITVFSQFMGRGSRSTSSLQCPPGGGCQVSSALLVELVAQCRVFRGELERLCATKDRLFYILKTAKEQRSKLKSYVTNLRADLRSLLAKMRQVEQGPGGGSSLLLPPSMLPGDRGRALGPAERREYQRRIDDLERVLKEEELRRKKLHNRLQELIGNIRVFCRVRPQTRSFLKTASEDKLVVIGDRLPDRLARPWAGHPGGRCFIFDRVFGPRATQPEVFEAVEELITSCVDGYNVCIMAYGQTGSGKTHTMMGSAHEPGVNRRAVCRLLASCGARPQWEYRLFLSMVEIYQEEVRDILTESGGGSTAAVPTPVRIMSSQDDEVTLHGLSEHRVRSEADIFRLFDRGERSRTVASTLLNMASSRSHLVVLLKVRGDSKIHLSSSVGTLTLCDLAGSENVTKSGATGERFSEATCINKSLTTLGRVFDALRNRQKPSYRETKLTYLLKPTLGGDSKCLLFVNVRCEPENAEETLRAIHFGINAMQVAPEKAQQRSKFRRTLGKISV